MQVCKNMNSFLDIKKSYYPSKLVFNRKILPKIFLVKKEKENQTKYVMLGKMIFYIIQSSQCYEDGLK